MNFKEIHDCKESENKIISLTVDKVGISRCGYCNEQIIFPTCLYCGCRINEAGHIDTCLDWKKYLKD